MIKLENPRIYYVNFPLTNKDIKGMVKNKITDVLVNASKYRADKNIYYRNYIPEVVKQFKGTGIRVHVNMVCFKDNTNRNISPTNQEHQALLLRVFDVIKAMPGISGLHLDYFRYPGTANGDTATLTNFAEKIKNHIGDLFLSASVMPEMAANPRYYGQDYTALSKHLYLFPMAYKGNYNKSSEWIMKVSSYVQGKAPGRFTTSLQTYRNDKNTTPLPLDELKKDIEFSRAGGSNGFALFRYGLSNYKI